MHKVSIHSWHPNHLVIHKYFCNKILCYYFLMMLWSEFWGAFDLKNPQRFSLIFNQAKNENTQNLSKKPFVDYKYFGGSDVMNLSKILIGILKLSSMLILFYYLKFVPLYSPISHLYPENLAKHKHFPVYLSQIWSVVLSLRQLQAVEN